MVMIWNIQLISIHVLRVEDDQALFPLRRLRLISIHVLRVEDDVRFGPPAPLTCVFQSTSSVWRTTAVVHERLVLVDISIHVLRVEDDQ